ncbi:class I SAM-dependent methyltransferase [Tautonia rosea]|uniref:class I SAM-dependent methyltransferase n=1 Tax=Tautonia rosea TaxID=2728037 RepID=UPI00147548ED|nr:class I SAM-dependent methyltransferase [Tautonia rosea]
MTGLPRIVELARLLVASVLRAGDFAIDATVGNGHDTLWLAQQVGPTGRVLGLDVQTMALRTAQGQLVKAGLMDRVLLAHARHESLDRLLSPSHAMGRPRVVMFNLGYLPGGDHSIATRPATTLAALDAALAQVLPGGLVSVVVYPGHPSGREESEQVLDWAHMLGKTSLGILRCDLLGTVQPAPWLLVLSPEAKTKTMI